MDYSTKIAEKIARLPAGLKQILDAELVAGNRIIDFEIEGVGDQGNIALTLDHPFRTKPESAPAGVLYREIKNRDPFIFEFFIKGEKYSLVTVKFKPMVLPTLGDGPPNPTEAHIAFMEKLAKQEEEAAAAKRVAPSRELISPEIKATLGKAANRFLASMNITYEMWHDGTGYDLNALAGVSPVERDILETLLIQHQPRDWRDIEALAVIDSPKARKEIEAALKSSDPDVRREAINHAGDKVDAKDRERLLIKALNEAKLYVGLSAAIDEAEEFHPAAVVDALFRGALNRDGEAAVHFAALLFYIHGKAKEAFDWDHRPFFLRFNTTDRKEREGVFVELCQIVGVDPNKYLH
jgi:hypothetical protein